MTIHGAITTWLLLLLLTALSYATWLDTRWADQRLAGSLVIALAMAKAWLIASRFMELRDAWWPLRLLMMMWLLPVGGTLIFLFGWAS